MGERKERETIKTKVAMDETNEKRFERRYCRLGVIICNACGKAIARQEFDVAYGVLRKAGMAPHDIGKLMPLCRSDARAKARVIKGIPADYHPEDGMVDGDYHRGRSSRQR